MDWDSDGDRDLVSGDRNGYMNLYVWNDSMLTSHLQMLLISGDTIDVGGNSQPVVVDWNGDGMKDLLLGAEDGYVRFYQNMTSDTWPMFQDFVNVEAAGSAIYQYRVNPYVFDLDRDGVQDLICGANDGLVQFYRNTGTNSDPVLAAPETLRTTEGYNVQPSGTYVYGSRCGFGDWNNDSLPDVLISGYDGYVDLFLGAPDVAIAEPRPARQTPKLIAHPNPFRSAVLLATGTLPAGAAIDIYDAAGNTVRTLPPGSTVWTGTDANGDRLPAGIYLARLSGADRTLSTRLVLLD